LQVLFNAPDLVDVERLRFLSFDFRLESPMGSNGLFVNRGVEVKVSGVSKRYRMAAEEVHALRESSWEVRTGEAVAIMGPSGCGKTTLLNLLGGVDRPTTGAILIDGKDLTQMSERDLEKHRLLKVGFVFQFFNLIPSLTAFENLELPMWRSINTPTALDPYDDGQRRFAQRVIASMNCTR
jgi:ABC-type lipoprotein export system ATPase subunit